MGKTLVDRDTNNQREKNNNKIYYIKKIPPNEPTKNTLLLHV